MKARSEKKLMMVTVAIAGLLAFGFRAQADNAEATFKAKCAACHGADGKGETPAGKAMKVKDFSSPEVQKLTETELSEAISKGKGKMPAVKNLTAGEVKDLTAYVRSLGKKK